MFGKSKNVRVPNRPGSGVRKLIHDLRASQHAAKLNAEAAQILAKKVTGENAARLKKHIELLNTDLDKFRNTLEDLSDVLKKKPT